MLTENVFNGGCGYTPQQVARFTPDQIYFRLCDSAIFKKKGGRRTKQVKPSEMGSGKLIAVTEDGKRIQGRIAPESLAKTMIRKAKERAARERELAGETARQRRRRERRERLAKRGLINGD